MKILITTGIYPPKVGGPAQYAKNLLSMWTKEGHGVFLKTFDIEDILPTGIRHIWFFFKIISHVLRADFILALDTYSVGFPTVFASKIFGKKVIIRTGGDFLWEAFVERTGEKILLKDFYRDVKVRLSIKEKIIFFITRWTLSNSTKVVFSTSWQRNIFVPAYGLDKGKTEIVENYYGKKEADEDPKHKDFIATTRMLVWKNRDILKKIFERIRSKNPEVEVYTSSDNFEEFMSVIKNCYAVILVSLGDISPNMILDAIRFNRPFICTKETGIYDRIKSAGTFVDPLDENEIETAVLKLLLPVEYASARERVRNFDFIHTWDEIGAELINVYNKS